MDRGSTISDVIEDCMYMTGDVNICAGIAGALLYVSTRRVFSYTPRGRPKPKFYLALPDDVDYRVDLLTDREYKLFAVVLRGPYHAVSLVYEREQDGRFVLSRTAVSNQEYAAMINGPIRPPEA
jgi:hypothetical protein